SLDTLVDDDSLLANFTDNNLEWFTQYHARFSPAFYEFLIHRKKQLEDEFAQIEKNGLPADADEKFKKELEERRAELPQVIEYLEKYDPKNFEKLPEVEKSIHKKAFTTNSGDPD